MTKEELKESLWFFKQGLIDQRNEIFDNLWSYLNPFRSKKLAELDAMIDCVDLMLYKLEDNDVKEKNNEKY